MVAQTEGSANSGHLEINHHDGVSGLWNGIDGINSLNGINGTSLIPKAETRNGDQQDNLSRVFIISAEDVNTTRTMAKNLATYLRSNKNSNLLPTDVAYTLAERRSRLSCTVAVRASSLSELVACLDRPHQLRMHTTDDSTATVSASDEKKTKRRLGFVFNGQGAQWHAMGRELLATYPVFASAVREADAVLRGFGADWSLQEELLRDAESTRVSSVHISQPSTVALQLALVNLLRSWNVYPSAVVSHSTGEFAAAYTVGALSFSQALGIVYHLGDLGRKYYHGPSGRAPGAMAAAATSAADVEKYLGGGRSVVVACINSPKSVTLSGDSDDVDEVVRRLDQDGVFARKLKVPLAYHSPHHMLPLAAEYTERLRQFLPPKLAASWTGVVDVYASPVTGAVVDSPQDVLTPEYYVRNLTKPVLFNDAFRAFVEHVDDVVEVGPHSTLSGPIRQILDDMQLKKLGYVTCLKRPVDAVHTMQDLACELVGLGYPVSLRGVNNPGSGHSKFVSDLPAYPWGAGSHSWADEEAVTSETKAEEQPGEEKVLLSKSTWELDILHDIPKPIKDSMRITLTQDEADRERTLVRASYYFMADAVAQLQSDSVEGWTAQQKDMLEWMVTTLAAGKRGDLGPSSALWSRASPGIKQELYDELSYGPDACAAGRLIARAGEKLAEIVRRQITSSGELVKEGDLLTKYYAEVPSLRSRAYKHLYCAAELFAVKNPGAKVLEIGAGLTRGGATRVVLDAFGSRGTATGGTLLGHYVATDTDINSLEATRRNLVSSPWATDNDDDNGLIEFRQLDIGEDPTILHQSESDSFVLGTFDLIVASMVFGATQNTNNALLHARKLLKPGGKLFLVETTEYTKVDGQLIFRALALSDGIKSPGGEVLSIAAWDEMLRDTGFTGVDFELPDNEHPMYKNSSFIISTAAATPTLPSAVSVVYTSASVPEAWHAQLTVALLEKTGIPSVIAERWDDFEPAPEDSDDKMYIFTGDMASGSRPFVESIVDQASFDKLRQFLVSSRNVVWLSHGGVVDDAQQDPAYAQTYGLLRTFRQHKDASRRLIHLDFERRQTVHGQALDSAWTNENIGHIVHVVRQTMDQSVEVQDVDWEYGVKDSMLHVPRILPVVPDDTEPKEALEPKQQPLDQLADPNATFLIVGSRTGGLGRIGREVALWLMAKGARNLLILVSRHHNETGVAADAAEVEAFLLERAEQKAVNLKIQDCDVSTEKSLVGMLSQGDVESIPPVRGVVVAPNTTSLDVTGVLEGTSFDQWKHAVLDKVAVITNLDSHLPPNLSFFILLSSLVGVVGYPVETDFAAGSTFQDAFARNRAATGGGKTAFISINLGPDVSQLGVDDVGSLMEAAIRRGPPATPEEVQVIAGLPPLSSKILAPGDNTPKPMWRDRRFGTLRLGIRRRLKRVTTALQSSPGTTVPAGPSALLAQALEMTTSNNGKNGAAEQEQVVALALRTRLADLLRIQEAEEIDLAKPLAAYGVDSVTAVDLRSWLAQVAEVKLSVLDILNAGSVYEVAKLVIARNGGQACGRNYVRE
ncbi:acyl transferase domain-containing protein [Apodospora peruviana]|uniref:Acyl transferase domain-containing protein n=1 Tax=Apodospora peruviana TaxID=516989 RepID=A0AAE0HW16_9PEZI|nr:acyl transferase domain-containing protein [Apodospora peruviana]